MQRQKRIKLSLTHTKHSRDETTPAVLCCTVASIFRARECAAVFGCICVFNLGRGPFTFWDPLWDAECCAEPSSCYTYKCVLGFCVCVCVCEYVRKTTLSSVCVHARTFYPMMMPVHRASQTPIWRMRRCLCPSPKVRPCTKSISAFFSSSFLFYVRPESSSWHRRNVAMMIIWSPWNPFNLYNDMVCEPVSYGERDTQMTCGVDMVVVVVSFASLCGSLFST